MHVYVITNPELGWDCVCGVIKATSSMTEAEAIKAHLLRWDNYDEDDLFEVAEGYVAHYCEVH